MKKKCPIDELNSLVKKRYDLVKKVELEKFNDEEHKVISECKIILDTINEFSGAYIALHIDRYLEKNRPRRRYRRPRPNSESNNIEDDFNREGWPAHWRGNSPVEVGTRQTDASGKISGTNIDPTTWGGIKKEFKE